MESTPEVELDEHDAADGESEAEAAGSAAKPKYKSKIEFEFVLPRSEAVAYFGALVAGLKHGQLQFRQGDEHLSLAPTEQVAIEVKATRKGNKEKVSFELEWKRVSDDTVGLSG